MSEVYSKIRISKNGGKSISLTLFVISIVFLLCGSQLTFSVNSLQAKSSVDVNLELDEIDFSRIMHDVEFFSSLKTRVTGYPDYYKAVDYIINEFNKLGLDVEIQTFDVPVPQEMGSWIYVNAPIDLNITAYALWPNGGLTASILDDLTGRVYYVGNGSLQNFNGIDLNDSILLMDFNSDLNWIAAAELGAKAVIFIEPAETDRYEALKKGATAPINFPRLYVNVSSGEILKEAAEKGFCITIHTEMRWKKSKAYNIIGKLSGEQEHDVIILSTYFDSWSIVPSVSPAAEASLSISTLLELARYFSSHKPLRTIWFVAYSGHFEGAIGSVEFAEKVLLNTEERVWLQLSLDLSSETPFLDVLSTSSIFGVPEGANFNPGSGSPSAATILGVAFSGQPEYATLRLNWVRSLFDNILTQISIKEFANKIPSDISSPSDMVRYNFLTSMWWGTQSDFYILDSEASNLIGGVGITLRTQGARRIHWLTPLNDLAYVNWENVQPQILLTTFILHGITNFESLGVDWSSLRPRRWISLAGAVTGFVTLNGTVAELSSETGWYEPVSEALVRLQIHPSYGQNCWPFAFRYTFADEKGSFIFYGLTPLVTWTLDAWKFDEKTGDIVYALDLGHYGTARGISGGISNQVYTTTSYVNIMIPLFRCTPVVLFDLIDFRTMRRIIVQDIKSQFHNYFAEIGASGIEPYEFQSKALPIFYGRYLSPEGIGILFVPQNSSYTFTYTPNRVFVSKPMILLTNSSEENPEGIGYLIRKPTVIHLTIFKSATDISRIIENRYSVLKNYYVSSPIVSETYEQAKVHLKKARQYLQNRIYDKAYSQAVVATCYLRLSYGYLMSLYNEAGISILFFSLLIIPFSVLFSKFLPETESVRWTGTFIFMALFLGIFYLVHPAFRVIPNSAISLMGIGVALLLIFILLIFSADIKSLLEKVAIDRLGFHLFKQESLSVMIKTISTSIENMKRRPLLTGLVFATIIIYTAAQTSLTSTTPIFGIVTSKIESNPPYNGILIKQLYGIPPESMGGVLDSPLITYLKGLVNEDNYTISPRVWFYPTPTYPEGVQLQFIYKDRVLRVNPIAVLGMTQEDLENFFPAVRGTNVFTGEYQCIIPENIANNLNISVGEKVYIRGLDNIFTVIGIISEKISYQDIDGSSVLPIDSQFSADLQLAAPVMTAEMEPFSFGPERVIIIPWKTALKLGGFISSVALIPRSNVPSSELFGIAQKIAYSLDVRSYVTYEGNSFGLWRTFTYELLGWNTLLVLMAIIALSIMNIMIGSLTMRSRETQIYSVLGLSPRGALFMYLTEALTLALGGTIIGYLVGFALNTLFIAWKILPESFAFNFASVSVLLPMGVLIAVVLLASLYPSIRISRTVTPSLERKWKVASKPKDDIWEIKMPLRVKETEVLGTLAFLQEYFEGEGALQPEFRTSKIVGIDPKTKTLHLEILLTPIELNITQDVSIQAVKEIRDYTFYLIVKRKTGEHKVWVSRCPSVMDRIRKQMLLWSSLSSKEREKYVKRANQFLKNAV